MELYQVTLITNPSSAKAQMYKLSQDNTIITHWFLRQDLLKIDPATLSVVMNRDEFVVEKVLAGPQIVDGKKKYLLKFVGYPIPEWTTFQKSFKKFVDVYEALPKATQSPSKPVAKITRGNATPATPVQTESISTSRSRRTINAPKRYQ